MPPEELEAVYASVIPLSVSKKYRIRRVFGTKNQSGIRFGIQVPAILVFEEGGLSPVDIYPRQEEQYRYVGICNYLVGLLRTSGLPNYERLVMLRNYNRQRRSL